MDNAHHLAWGYVVYPPVTTVLARIELIFFGPSLRGFRFFPAVAPGLIMLLTGLSARELGGKREAQLLAAVAIGISGYALFPVLFFLIRRSTTSGESSRPILSCVFCVPTIRAGESVSARPSSA